MAAGEGPLGHALRRSNLHHWLVWRAEASTAVVHLPQFAGSVGDWSTPETRGTGIGAAKDAPLPPSRARAIANAFNIKDISSLFIWREKNARTAWSTTR